MLLTSFAGVRNVRTLCFTSSVLPAYRLGCASAWHADDFVVVYGPGRVHQRLQRGAVGVGWCCCVLGCICSLQMFKISGRCVSRVVACCYRSGWVVLVLGMQMFFWLFMA